MDHLHLIHILIQNPVKIKKFSILMPGLPVATFMVHTLVALWAWALRLSVIQI